MADVKVCMASWIHLHDLQSQSSSQFFLLQELSVCMYFQVERFLVREVPPKDVNQMYQKGLETVLRGLVPATPPVARKAADPPYNPQPTAQVLVMMGSNDYLRVGRQWCIGRAYLGS